MERVTVILSQVAAGYDGGSVAAVGLAHARPALEESLPGYKLHWNLNRRRAQFTPPRGVSGTLRIVSVEATVGGKPARLSGVEILTDQAWVIPDMVAALTVPCSCVTRRT